MVAFSPSFAFILLGAHRFDQIRHDRKARAFLDGAGPAAIGAIFGSAIRLTRALTHHWQYAVLGGTLILLLLLRRGVVLALLCAGVGRSRHRADRQLGPALAKRPATSARACGNGMGASSRAAPALRVGDAPGDDLGVRPVHHYRAPGGARCVLEVCYVDNRRVLAPAAGEERCHFLVQWRDGHAVQHGRTFTTWQEAAEFDAAIKAGRLPRDAPGRQAAVTFGTAAARWLATKRATKRPSTADLYATELRTHVLPAFASVPLPDITRRDVQDWVNTLAAAGLSAATVRHAYRAVFKSVLSDAIDDGLLARSP